MYHVDVPGNVVHIEASTRVAAQAGFAMRNAARTMMAEHEAAGVLAMKMLALLHALAGSPAVHAALFAAGRHSCAHWVVAGLSRARLLGRLSLTIVQRLEGTHCGEAATVDIEPQWCEYNQTCQLANRRKCPSSHTRHCQTFQHVAA